MAFNYRKKTIFPHRYSKIFYDYWWSQAALWGAMKKRLGLEKDVLVLVTGQTGSGKSHMTGNLCFKHGEKDDNFITENGKKMFIPEENFIIDPEEFAAKMITKSGEVFWLDEGRNAANRRNWQNSVQKTIVNRKNTNRKLLNIYFMLLPYEREFDPSMASHLTMWIWVKKRGVCELYVRTSGMKGGTGLNIQKILDREEKWLKENPKKTMVNPMIHPEYIGRMAFGKLTKNLKKKYDELVKLKNAAGELTNEEKIKFGIEIKRTPEEVVQNIIKDIKDGKIKDKKSVWNAMKEVDDTDANKLKTLNFYLKLENWSTFNKLFDQEKLKQVDIDW